MWWPARCSLAGSPSTSLTMRCTFSAAASSGLARPCSTTPRRPRPTPPPWRASSWPPIRGSPPSRSLRVTRAASAGGTTPSSWRSGATSSSTALSASARNAVARPGSSRPAPTGRRRSAVGMVSAAGEFPSSASSVSETTATPGTEPCQPERAATRGTRPRRDGRRPQRDHAGRRHSAARSCGRWEASTGTITATRTREGRLNEMRSNRATRTAEGRRGGQGRWRCWRQGTVGRVTTAERSTAQELIDRSRRLGADPRNTNYAGGNTSAKGDAIDPVTGTNAAVLWVKGSGGDLGTLTTSGLSVLRLDRLRSLVDVYPGVDREDEMVAAFDHCLFGKGGAAPSIDTAMHGLVDAPHVDHLHPDSGIALATAADGEALTRACFGERVAWVPWRRPGFQLGLDMAQVQREHPEAIGAILGGHGITAWGPSSEACEANSLEIIRTAERYIAEHGRPSPFGQALPAFEPLEPSERHAKAAAIFPTIRGLASTDAPQVGHYTDSEAVLDFLAREKLAPLAELGTSCPDHFLRTKVKPLVVD